MSEMKVWTEKDIENLITDSAFLNSAHKKALRDRLLGESVLLDLDELEMVAGGKGSSGTEEWILWPGAEEKKP